MSKIEVNTIDTQCGSALQIGCTNTATIGLGKSGDTITIPCGATIVNSGTQTGFGRTGTVDWITTPKVTGDSPVTAVTGEGYFLNTTAGTITLNLPAGSAGDIVSMMDYAATWDTNKVTVAANGSEKIGGVAADVDLSTEGQSVTLVYVDSTQGWLNTMDSTSNVRASDYVAATGGTPCSGAICGDYKIHTFTGPGTLTVSAGGSVAGSNSVGYMVIAGGGSGSTGCTCTGSGAGGGAGGYREGKPACDSYTASPIVATATVPVSATGYPIVVGGGGATVTAAGTEGTKGSDSSFSTITSTGGGGGRRSYPSYGCSPGGSGGGGGAPWPTAPCTSVPGGVGDDPSTTPDQGFPGGTTPDNNNAGGGGGGATAVGGNATPAGGAASTGGTGGAGTTTSIDATPTARAGGGGGMGNGTPGPGGTGGGGAGGRGPSGGVIDATAGSVNTGGGGGGAWKPYTPAGSGGGGSGIVIIRYKFQ